MPLACLPPPVYYKDVLPVLQSRCQGCHRPGEEAPISFLTCEETRPRAKAIREAVLVRRMPPWPADPRYGKFSNGRSVNWLLTYCPKEPIVLPKGTRIECTAHFDNSPNNPAGPGPTHEVEWGDQSRQEMMTGWFDMAIDAGQKPLDVFRRKKAHASDH